MGQPGNPMYRIEFSPRGDMIATCSFDGCIVLFDTNTGRELCTFKCHESRYSPFPIYFGWFWDHNRWNFSLFLECQLWLWLVSLVFAICFKAKRTTFHFLVKQRVSSLSWNALEDSLIATSSMDGYVKVIELDHAKLSSIRNAAVVMGSRKKGKRGSTTPDAPLCVQYAPRSKTGGTKRSTSCRAN